MRTGNFKFSTIRRAGMKLFQNVDASREFFIVESVVPLTVVVPVRHTLEANALNHKKFNQERRPLVVFCGLRFGFMQAGYPVHETQPFAGC
jgi:hypothetical protein